MRSLRQSYIEFLEKDQRNLWQTAVYCFLLLLSGIYWLIVSLRNFFYDKAIFKSYQPKTKVISVGNLSWAGSGKTSLTIWLERQLSSRFRVAVLRRGYGKDEELLLKEISSSVYSAPDRAKLASRLDSQFDFFILDDGFQHRKLKRHLNIVIMAAREFRKKPRLIPAYFFREPLTSLKRADFVIINYSDELYDRSQITGRIKKFAPNSKLYFSKYLVREFKNLDSELIDPIELKKRKLAAFAAIGYPEGFFGKLEESGLNVCQKIVYPDHHELSISEYCQIEENLLSQGIHDLIITAKDKYHFPSSAKKLNIVIMSIDIAIENADVFLSDVRLKLAKST